MSALFTEKEISVGPVEAATETDLLQGAYIILLDALTVPPHLFVSVNGVLFSITVNGRQTNGSLQNLLGLIGRKKTPVLFAEWKMPEGWDHERLKNELRKNVLQYKCVEEGKVSCLFPIRDTAAAVLGDEMQQANFIFELFPLMQAKNALGKCFGIHLSPALDENKCFHLLVYTAKELNAAIQAAKTAVLK